MDNKFATILKIIYGALILLLPIICIAYVYTHEGDFSTLTPFTIRFLESTFFLVILLNLFFMVLYNEDHELSVPALLSLIIGPLVSCISGALFGGQSIMLYVVQLGMTYVIELTLAFTILIPILAIIVMIDSIRTHSLGDMISGLFPIAAQGLFLIPSIGAAFIFGKIVLVELIPQTIPGLPPHQFWVVAIYAIWIIPIVQNMIAFFWDFKNETDY